MVDHVSAFLRCALCGDRIGVYEPIWLELADGRLHRSSFLNLGDHQGTTNPGCGTLTAQSPK